MQKGEKGSEIDLILLIFANHSGVYFFLKMHKSTFENFYQASKRPVDESTTEFEDISNSCGNQMS